jgi:hypothetical protein
MKKIKAAVGQDNLIAGRTPLVDLLCQLRGIKDFLDRRRQSALRYGAQKLRASYGGRATLHYHNAAGVIGQPCRGF